jgi:hypothetical protein
MIDGFLILEYPQEDLDGVISIVKNNSSFIALIEGDIYNIPFYLWPSELKDYTAVLDRNFYTRITKIARGEAIPHHAIEDYQWAAAVMAFCQIAEISFQYSSSLQEYASHKGGESAVDDYKCFYLADNCDPKAWVDFALGRTSRVDFGSNGNLPPLNSQPQASEFETPIYEFRANYIFALKLSILSREMLSPERSMLKFIDWMENEFVLGSAAFLFANLHFSPSRIKGMLKTKSLKGIRNIAWDFALIQHWRRCAFKGHSKKTPVLLISRDKVVRYIANRLCASSIAELKSIVTDPWEKSKHKGESIFKRYCILNDKIQNATSGRKLPSDEELDKITEDLETLFLDKLT